MAITNHNTLSSIYQMILDRLPYLVDDSCDVFDLEIVSVIEVDKLITITGDYTSYLRRNTTHYFVDTDTFVVVDSFSYDLGSNTTTVIFKELGVGVAVVGQTFRIEGNYSEKQISRYTGQMMRIMQSCFNFTPAQFGDEAFYSEIQRMIIAELVCYYLVFQQTVINSQGDSNSSETLVGGRRINKAKAGEVETTWSMFKLSDSGLFYQSAEAMMEGFKANAKCYAEQMGCTVQICGGSISCACSLKTPFVSTPFIIRQDKKSCKW